ncbi:MAG TPA: hypothetical protein VGR47_00610 [Terracidiphilus sp.]|nr:hypothetical protein [Terracidiphilus sp.]
MVDPKLKSKKRSPSKKQKRLKGFTLYLDHNLDYDELVEKLERAGIRYKRHREFFAGSVADTVLLQLVGRKRWVLVTFDKKQRTRFLERKLIEQFKIREFAFTSAEIGDPGDLLVKASREMRNLVRTHQGPFIASISKSGKVYFRRDDWNEGEKGSK